MAASSQPLDRCLNGKLSGRVTLLYFSNRAWFSPGSRREHGQVSPFASTGVSFNSLIAKLGRGSTAGRCCCCVTLCLVVAARCSSSPALLPVSVPSAALGPSLRQGAPEELLGENSQQVRTAASPLFFFFSKRNGAKQSGL